jgi:2-iminobutanoate/2-iminopropanoate deaminase
MRLKIIACAAAIAMASAAQAAPPRYIGSNPDAVFSQAVQAGDFLILSGMLSAKHGTIEEEAKGTMDSIGGALKANGLGFGDVAKCTVMIKDMSEWGRLQQGLRHLFRARPSPRSQRLWRRRPGARRQGRGGVLGLQSGPEIAPFGINPS